MKSAFCFLSFLTILFSCNEPLVEVDVLIKGGTIIDGSGKPAFIGDIGMIKDKIVFVKKGHMKAKAPTVIDAVGMTVSPGFIDPHTHATRDLSDSTYKSNLNYLYQGVTTVFIGNDGRSATDIAKQFDQWENNGIGTNAATYVGHASTRRTVMGMRNDMPTQEEMNNMKTIVRRGMEAGALGLSSGLYYAPASYATTDEVIELARVAAEYNGVYDVHMRDESTYNIGLLEAVRETIKIAEGAGMPGHIAHIKCLGVDVWGKSKEVIKVIEEARSRGVQITADQYPYRASGTSITGALVPRWALATDEPSRNFENAATKRKIIADMEENLRRRGGASTLLLTAPNKTDQDLTGKYLDEVAEQWNTRPVDAAITIFLRGGSGVASFNMNEEDIQNFMRQPWVMTGSDGSHGHPRKYGSFPKKLKEYVLQKEVLSLEEMVHRSAGLTAQTFGIEKRGVIREGYFADIIVFDLSKVKDNATFESPTEYSEGIEHVIVNGKSAIKNGRYTGELAGKGIRKNRQS